MLVSWSRYSPLNLKGLGLIPAYDDSLGFVLSAFLVNSLPKASYIYVCRTLPLSSTLCITSPRALNKYQPWLSLWISWPLAPRLYLFITSPSSSSSRMIWLLSQMWVVVLHYISLSFFACGLLCGIGYGIGKPFCSQKASRSSKYLSNASSSELDFSEIRYSPDIVVISTQ